MDMFINMRQALCGHWEIGKNTYSVTKWSFKNFREHVYYRYISAKFAKNQKYCSITEKRQKSNIVTILSIICWVTIVLSKITV